jgi:hypothetical protein
MAKEPVKRQKAMFGAVGGGNSTEPEKVSNCYDTLCHTTEGDGLSTDNFEEESVRPVGKEHSGAGSAPKSAGSEPSGTLVSAGSALALGKTGNAGGGAAPDRHSLKEALQALNLTLEEFSVLANTSLDTVKKWSSGKTKTPGIALAMVRLLAQMR